MTIDKGIYDPIEIGEIGEELELSLVAAGFVVTVLRQIIKELPPDLDAAKLALMAKPFAECNESRLDHLLERLKNGGVL